MCNELHATSKRNWKRKFGDKDWGIGYKVFCTHPRNKKILHPAIKKGTFKIGEWIQWNQKINDFSDGFCFFLTFKDAKKYSGFSGWKIRKIRYRRALGCHYEFSFNQRHWFAICKEFKILEEVKE